MARMAGATNRNSKYYQDDQGNIYDAATGDQIRPGDPRWQPEWDAVNAQNSAMDAQLQQGKIPNFSDSAAADPSKNYGLRMPSSFDEVQGLWAEAPMEWKLMVLGAAGIVGGEALAAATSSTAPDAVGAMYAAGGPEAGGAASSAVGASVGGTEAAAGGAGSAALKGLTTAEKIGNLTKGIGSEIGSATNAAANNRSEQSSDALKAAGLNITGQSAFENELMARASEEDRQRLQARKDAYRASVADNPTYSPFNTRPQPLSKQFVSTYDALGNQAADKLATKGQYDTSNMPALAPYQPIDYTKLPSSKKGTLEQVGDWLSPTLSTIGTIAKFFG